MINLVDDKTKCSGCAACVNVCPVNAITMAEDEDGFVYPSISSALCIKCEQCISVCPFKKEICPESDQETYAAIANNADLRESSSGAVFPGIAEDFLKEGGVVFGCSMQYENNEITVKHIRVDNIVDLKKLKGSKYVQSDTGLIYRAVKNDLTDDKNVLFSGTPCQVAGLYGFLKRDYPNLYTVDIVCHGVPSQKFFHSYLQYEEESTKLQIRNFVFRDKSKGWKLYGRMEGVDCKGNPVTRYFEAEDSSYYQLFLDKYTYRESCYHCPFASKHRPGNITVADFWNIDLVHPELMKENGGPIDTSIGVSALVVNNQKGRELINTYRHSLSLWSSSYENASRYNKQFLNSSSKPADRDAVIEEIKLGYHVVDTKYKAKLRKKKIERKIRAAIPKAVKEAIKNLMK